MTKYEVQVSTPYAMHTTWFRWPIKANSFDEARMIAARIAKLSGFSKSVEDIYAEIESNGAARDTIDGDVVQVCALHYN